MSTRESCGFQNKYTLSTIREKKGRDIMMSSSQYKWKVPRVLALNLLHAGMFSLGRRYKFSVSLYKLSKTSGNYIIFVFGLVL